MAKLTSRQAAEREQLRQDIQQLLGEEILTLAEASKEVPGGPVHVSTIHRWRLRGVRHVRLETALCGGVRVTSRQALQRFFARITMSADEPVSSGPDSLSRQAAVNAAERALEADGM